MYATYWSVLLNLKSREDCATLLAHQQSQPDTSEAYALERVGRAVCRCLVKTFGSCQRLESRVALQRSEYDGMPAPSPWPPTSPLSHPLLTTTNAGLVWC